jgi:tyrosine decarboxylase / aspartate 1-decarboxylase
LSREVFQKAAAANLHLAVVTFPASLMRSWWPDLTWDQEQVTCLRSCLMKPEHLDWLDRIWQVLDGVMIGIKA